MVTNRELKRELWELNTKMNEKYQVYETKLDYMMSVIEKIADKVEGISKIVGDKYIITCAKPDKNSFFWVTNAKATDVISKEAQCGRIFLDSEILALFRQKNGTFIDLGANIGAFSLSFASEGWNGFAFEAGQENSNVLKKSIMLNDFNIKVIEKVVCEKSGKKFFVSDGPWGRVIEMPNKIGGGGELEAIALDDWYGTEDIEKIDLIKIDIEGSEVAAFRGMEKMLEAFNFPPIFTEVNAFALALQGETPYSYFSQVERLGYRIYEKYNGNLYEYSKDIFPIDFCRDYIFLKDVPERIEKKVFGRIANNDGRMEQVLARLKNYKQWSEMTEYGHEINVCDYDSYLCFVLKDYPQFITEEIRELLLKLKTEQKENGILQSFLNWI